MPYWGAGPEECDYAFDAVGAYVYLIKDRMLKDITKVIDKSYPEQSIIASLACLRQLGERFPKILRMHFGKKDYALVKSSFDEWYTKVSDKLPPEYRDAILAKAQQEFALFEEGIFKHQE